MAVMSVRRNVARSCRNAITLIEIMASVMVLSIGLVGVLAAIPFGGMRMAQMNEADYSSAVGRLGVRMMNINGWANPKNWYLRWGAQVVSNRYSVASDANSLNLKFPYMIDPYGSSANSYTSKSQVGERSNTNVFMPSFREAYFGDNEPAVFYTLVSPVIGSGILVQDNNQRLTQRYERAFYLQDDISTGYDLSEDEAEFRPYVESEKDEVVGDGEIPSFSGRYTWFATVYPKSNTGSIFSSSLDDINNADFDVVVFKDRRINEERVMPVTVDGSGYQGGTVTLDLSSMRSGEDELCNSESERSALLEQLQNTKYIAILGKDGSSEYPCFFRWYKIADYAIKDPDQNGAPSTVRVSLIGSDIPLSLNDQGKYFNTFYGIFFPGVVGVYSSSSSF